MVPVTPVSDAAKPAAAPLAHPSGPSRLVGRLAEMVDLEKRFGLALSGQRQIVFVTGEPGIGRARSSTPSPTGSIAVP